MLKITSPLRSTALVTRLGMQGVRSDEECAKHPEESFSQLTLFIEYDHGMW